MKALLDYIPMIVFFYLYKTTDKTNPHHPLLDVFGMVGSNTSNHTLVATLGLMLCTVLVYGALFVIQKFRFEKQQLFVLILTVVFGSITLALKDDFYIRLKAILINLGFAAGLFLSPWFLNNKESVVQKLLGPIFELPKQTWKKLNWVWSLFFVFMASLHGFFAFVFKNGQYWGEFTAFGDLIVMIIFMLAMFVVLRKHIKLDELPKK